ncbi:tail protein X [Methylocystis sp. L43]|uniref:tail protein X n=1 Tax=unclassified Methylocystis TaxID=2625913 RepID=UPI0018C2E263|nr:MULTISPECIES: tail protein X [unclassified Methylocystis]MBG0796865.1 tail protein X [Methylocystis sp. L43]MBG0806152.1 tail protein X [Methylocystis sp. H15]
MKRLIIEPVRLDILAREQMGSELDGAMEALLDANPGLAKEGSFVVAPRVVEIPPTPEKPTIPNINPWD